MRRRKPAVGTAPSVWWAHGEVANDAPDSQPAPWWPPRNDGEGTGKTAGGRCSSPGLQVPTESTFPRNENDYILPIPASRSESLRAQLLSDHAGGRTDGTLCRTDGARCAGIPKNGKKMCPSQLPPRGTEPASPRGRADRGSERPRDRRRADSRARLCSSCLSTSPAPRYRSGPDFWPFVGGARGPGIDFGLPAGVPARTSVLDVTGRKIARVLDQWCEAGLRWVVWTGRGGTILVGRCRRESAASH